MISSPFQITPEQLYEARRHRVWRASSAQSPAGCVARRGTRRGYAILAALGLGILCIIVGTIGLVALHRLSAIAAAVPLLLVFIIVFRILFRSGLERARQEHASNISWSKPSHVEIHGDVLQIAGPLSVHSMHRDWIVRYDELPTVLRVMTPEFMFLIDRATFERDGLLVPLREWIRNGGHISESDLPR
jgi:hypothetical protein